MPNRRTIALALAASLTVATLAQAQDSARVPESPVVYTGAILSTDDSSVRLNTKNGPVTVQMKPGWTVASSRTAKATDIKPGDFIATNNLNIGPTSGRSTEVRIFEPNYRPEYSSHPMPTSGYSMTHALVGSSTKAADGQQLVVTYPGGSRNILVPPDVKVVAYDIQGRGLASPGTTVIAVTRKDPDGVARAGRLLLVAK